MSPRAGNNEDAIYGTLKPFVVPTMTRQQDITHVIVSHCHFDHTAGLYLFPHAVQIINGDE